MDEGRLAVAVLLLAVLAGIGAFALAVHLAIRQRRVEEAVALMRQDLGALCAGAVGLGSRVVDAERRLRALGDRQERLELQAPDEKPYAQAMRLAKGGAASEDLVKQCGLNREEADLILLMRRLDERRG